MNQQPCSNKKCKGECFEQSLEDKDGDWYTYKESTCKPPCQLVQCPVCKKGHPQVMLDKYKGKCMVCSVSNWKGPGFCIWCGSTEKLVKQTDMYHEKCLSEWHALQQV
jgi:hypothetical protein